MSGFIAQPPPPDSISDLVAWFKQHGGLLNKVEIVATADSAEYGVFACIEGQVPQESEVVISVPYQLCISVDSILSSPLGVIFKSEDFGGLLQYPDEVMAVGLMAGLSPGLPWSLHVSTMPKTINSTLYWTEDELLELLPCTTYHLTKMMQKQIQNDWDTIHAPLAKAYPDFLVNASVANYRWALSMIYSR